MTDTGCSLCGVYLHRCSGFCSCLSVFHSKTLGSRHTQRGGGGTVGKCPSKEESDRQRAPPTPGHGTHPRGHTAEVYQEKRYWQSAVSWLNSGIPSSTKGSQWKKMVEETVLVLSFPHLEDEVKTTSRSPSARKEGDTATVALPPLFQPRLSLSLPRLREFCVDFKSGVKAPHQTPPGHSSSQATGHALWSPCLTSVCKENLNPTLKEVWLSSSANNTVWRDSWPQGTSVPGD